MMDLQSTLRCCFENDFNDVTWGNNPTLDMNTPSIIIPINKEEFEIPVFALDLFNSMLRDSSTDYNNLDALVLQLLVGNRTCTYKSLDSRVRNILIKKYKISHLWKLIKTEDPEITYYATSGAIFNQNYEPVMLMTWQMRKVHTEVSPQEFEFVRPILRVSPEVIVNKVDPVQRHIGNKIIPLVLAERYISRPTMDYSRIYGEVPRSTYYRVKVIIDKMPFPLQTADVPSISTTNEVLLNIALNYIDEVVQ